MALPAIVVAGAVKLIASQAVRAAAADAAEKLARNVYGRVMGERPDGETDASSPGLEEMVAGLPTREEIIASFALLQAELDQRHKRTTALLAAVAVMQAATLAWLLLRG